MKTAILSILVGLGTFAQIQAQESFSNNADIRIVNGKKDKKESALPAPKRLSVPKRKVTYTGFWSDLFSGRKKVSIPPKDPAAQGNAEKDNVYTDPATDKPKGFVFFAIRF